MNFIVRVLFVAVFTAMCSFSYAQQQDGIQTGGGNILAETDLVSFASSSKRFARQLPPEIVETKTWEAKAWKNEKVHTQILTYSSTGIPGLRVAFSDLADGKGNMIRKENISAGFVQYVMTDEYRDGCGHRKSTDYDSSLVADLINTSLDKVSLDKNTTQPIWLTIHVPADAVAGNYKGTVTITAGKEHVLQVGLTVIERALPAPANWKYDLDLWQHPAAIARVHKVPLWSDEHFSLMKKYYTMLADAGQKTITASIVNEPWGHQTYDDYPSLIRWTKKKNGDWSYDYQLFDKYVSFVMSCGIKERISCYSMVPWKIAFSYYDEALQKDTVFTDAIGTPAYNAFWSVMLKDFTKHLKQKNWFGITSIAMDERPMAAMQSVISLLKTIDKNWKISLTGAYHPEIENDVTNYCVASEYKFPADVLAKREKQGMLSTWYTCCAEKLPNGFTFSPPDEHVWMGWYTAATKMDGYLRWAFNSWTKEPLKDSRFISWPAGDTYQVYPGPLTSIRFEKMIEGIQDYEKIQILLREYKEKNDTVKLATLEAALKTFEISRLGSEPAQVMVDKYKHLLTD